MDLPRALAAQIAALAADSGAERVLLFGSRARGDSHPRSDIDLAVFGMPEHAQARFRLALEELPTLLKCDVVAVHDGLDPELLTNITREGVPLYEQSA